MTVTEVPRIGFNMWPYDTTRGGGIVYYALSLLREFCRVAPERSIVFYGSQGKGLLNTIEEFRSVENVQINHPSELYDYRSRFDVLFTPHTWSGANMLDYPTVNVIADIQEKYYPQFFSDADLQHRHIYYSLSARASTLLITISDYSKATMVENFEVPAEKIRVTHLGAHPTFSDVSNLGTRPASMPNAVRDYLFYPANAWTHKNHKRLLEALCELKSLHGLEIDLVLTGHLLQGDFNRVDIVGEIENRGLQNNVFHIGTVSLSELKYLYLNARALVHPSLFEGFGIPLVEAMSCGCPIIAADRTSIPEVTREAALYFNPDDPSDIAQKIKHFLESPAENSDRVTIGKRLSKEFSDRRTAEETLAILEDAYHLASGEGLKAAALARPRSSRLPLLTAVFFFSDTLDQDIAREIVRLVNEFGGELQVITILPPDSKPGLNRMLGATVETVKFEGDFSAAIREAVRRANGKHIFLSDGHSVILSNFLYYLMAYDGIPQNSADILFGDSYFWSASEGKTRDAGVPVGLQDEDFKPYCCLNLSFVVSTEAFRKMQTDALEKCDSLTGLANELWDLCSRKRVYKIVNMLFEHPTNPDRKVSIAMERLHRRFPTESSVGRCLRSDTIKFALRSMLPYYFRLPEGLRLPILGLIRRFLTICQKSFAR